MKRLAPLLLLAAVVAGPARAQEGGAPPVPPPATDTNAIAADYAKIDAVIAKLGAKPAPDEAAKNALLDDLRAASGEFLDKHAAKANRDQLLSSAGMWFDLSLRKDDKVPEVRARVAALRALPQLPPELTKMMVNIETACRAIENRPNVAPGKKAPSWTGQDILSGAQVTLESLKGKVVLMDFWASWCPPCKVLMAKELAPLHARLKDVAGFQLVGMGLPWRGDTAEKEKQFAEENGYHWTKVFTTADTAETYGVIGIPSVFLIDGDGTVIAGGAADEVMGTIKAELTKRFNVEFPKEEAPKADAPKADAPKADAPKPDGK